MRVDIVRYQRVDSRISHIFQKISSIKSFKYNSVNDLFDVFSCLIFILHFLKIEMCSQLIVQCIFSVLLISRNLFVTLPPRSLYVLNQNLKKLDKSQACFQMVQRFIIILKKKLLKGIQAGKEIILIFSKQNTRTPKHKKIIWMVLLMITI